MPVTKKAAVKTQPRRRLELTQEKVLPKRKTLPKRPATETSDLADPAQIAQMAAGQLISLEEESKVPVVERPEDPMVTAVIPRPYRLQTEVGAHVEYQPGICEMPKSHAEHWFSRAQGVTIYQAKSE